MSHPSHPFSPKQNKSNNEAPSSSSPPPPLSPPSLSTSSTAAALHRLDDKLATGMSITDVAKLRWLTPVEVLQYLDNGALLSSSTSVSVSSNQSIILRTALPEKPPKTGTLLVYNASQTPNYAEDGIKWIEDVDYNDKWMNLGDSDSDIDSDYADGNIGNLGDSERRGRSRGNNLASSTRSGTGNTGTAASELSSSSAILQSGSGAWVDYLSCADRPTFHRREYRYRTGTGSVGSPNKNNDNGADIVLLHYLDSVRALRMTNELVDRIVLLSADDSGAASSRNGTPKHERSNSGSDNNNNDNNNVVNNSSSNGQGEGNGNNGDGSTSWGLTSTSTTEEQTQLQEQSSKPKKTGQGRRKKKHARTKSDLGDTMNILMNLVDNDDADPFAITNPTTPTTVVEAAVEENILHVANEAALKAVMKHISPDEATEVVDAIEMEMAMMADDNNNNESEELSGILSNDSFMMNAGDIDIDIDSAIDSVDDDDDNAVEYIYDVTGLDIDEAIEQVLTGTGGSNDDDADGTTVSKTSGSDNDAEDAVAAKIIEDKILDSMEEVLPEELKTKLIETTEKMLEASGVSLNVLSGGGDEGCGSSRRKKAFEHGGDVSNGKYRAVSFEYEHDAASSATGPIIDYTYTPSSSSSGVGHPLPEIVDITPDFHVTGHVPPVVLASVKERQRTKKKKKQQKQQPPSVVLSTETPIPDLPPYVDQFYVWEKFAAFVDFQEAVDDPQVQVRNVSFQRLKGITPYSYKCKIPTDIPNFSIRHVVVVGVLLPKDHRVRRNMHGIELALKLCVQTEWGAAADLVGTTLEQRKSIEEKICEKIHIKGTSRPSFIAPCGGTRMQLLTQISGTKFTMYPAASSPVATTPPNFIQKVVMNANDTGPAGERGREEKRKRERYLEEWAAAPDNDASMSTAEVDRHRKVRFVERLSNAITDTKSASENVFEGVDVEGMNDDEIDSFLGRVLVRFVEVLVEGSTSEDELKSEINYCGYAGLSLLHHACFCNFGELISLLLKRGANPNLGSAEGDATPLHFAAAAGHKDAAEILIKSGCEPCPVDSSGQTPADHARRAGHIEIAQVLGSMNPSSSYVKWLSSATAEEDSIKNKDAFLQSAFKELSLRDKLGLNLFVDQSQSVYGAPVAYIDKNTFAAASTSMMDDKGDKDNEVAGGFSFISKQDRAKLREAMSLASEMDLKEMNRRAEHQDVRRYLRQSNYEAISSASKALARANKKESDILKSVSSTQNNKDPSKMQLSRALAMLVLRKNLPV